MKLEKSEKCAKNPEKSQVLILITLSLSKMAVNMECTDLVTPLSGCNSVLFPVFWADEAADLDDENYELWVHDVERPTKMVLGFCIAAGMVLGFLIAAGGIYLCWKA